MSNRGEFRTIEAGLLDQPAFQELSAEAQHLYLVLLCSLGPLRIQVIYDEAIRGRWGNRSQDALEAAREELCSGDWLRVEGRVHQLPRAIDCLYHPESSKTQATHARLLLANLRGSHLAEELANEVGLEPDSDRTPVHSLSDSPSRRPPAQDNTTENKTTQQKNETNTPALRAGDKEHLDRDVGWTEPIAEAIRSRWWLGETPPEKAPQGWSMGAELQRFRKWRDAGVSRDDMLRFIDGGARRRDNGDLPGVEIGEGVTVARFTHESPYDPEAEWTKNIRAHWAEQERSDGVRPGGEPSHISHTLGDWRERTV